MKSAFTNQYQQIEPLTHLALHVQDRRQVDRAVRVQVFQGCESG